MTAMGLRRWQLVGVKAGTHFGEAGKAVGNAFDEAQPCGGGAHGRQERGKDGGGRFMRPIAEERRQTDAEHGAIKPANGGAARARDVGMAEFIYKGQPMQLHDRNLLIVIQRFLDACRG